MERHALAFRIKPGTQDQVRDLLSGYRAPALEADDGTRLLGTAVFLHGDLVVRVMEFEGDLGTVARHLSADPVIREVERGLIPYLADSYDPADAVQRREFFARRLTERLAHRGSANEGKGARHALLYPVKPGMADVAARVLAAAEDPPLQAGATTLCSTSVFRKGDVLVRVFEIDGDVGELVAGLAQAVEVHEVGRRMAGLFDGAYDFTTAAGLEKFFTDNLMATVTDRRAGA
ncbi:SchA/CurD-like domain-containing protein [Actinomadura napierensis]|uniref:SchA/CurD-like domain-containing protein n=1 Tax=Actinomadura napierensis TaxID=267854 RepID=A0ABP5LMA6_9ACTN